MLKEVSISMGARIVASLPAALLRLFLKPERLASKIKIDLRPNGPGEIVVMGTGPQLRLWFTVKNWSGFSVILDRMSLQIYVDHQLVCYAVIVDRIEIPGPSEVEQPHFFAILSNDQVQFLRSQPTDSAHPRQIGITGRAYLSSKLGWFVKDLNIERGGFPCRL